MALRIAEIKTTITTIPMIASTTIDTWFMTSWFIKTETKDKVEFREWVEGMRPYFIVVGKVSEIREKYPDDYIITFVRNPYDYVCSQIFRAGKPYKITVKHLQSFFNSHSGDQSTLIDQEVDYLGHFETLQDDINKLTKILDFPKNPLDHTHKNKFKKKNWLNFLDPAGKEFIYKLCKKDFKFGYRR